jgi:hypothetical protein
MMIPAVIEKVSYDIALVSLFARHRLPLLVLAGGGSGLDLRSPIYFWRI